ncbi:hypothetical protein SAMN05216337_1020142 [Bradyrhizobium brasilense]|uniref:Uncharacterized protein n=1 Tax=Bradyrhizobium brasilense TaxID=1419277 RepID=A0A1G7AIS4_9BRAD|nr:hypothetical protein [Bradyrhizobium brasilense]SDE14620.1 hypothetical protein SAMN05216337_1020142 [Bradyrhizobium brasilense]
MHGIIGDRPQHDKPTPVLRFDHYLDTTSWYFPVYELMTIEQKRLRDLYDGHKPHRGANKNRRDQILTFQCPQPDLIDELERLVVKYGGNLSRCDIASDVRPGCTSMDYIEQTQWLMNGMLMRGRKAAPVLPFLNIDGTIGTIWNPFSKEKGEKPPERDAVAYPDPASKLPHGMPSGHFDTRLRRKARFRTMKAQGIGPGLKSLKMLDPAQVLRENFKFVLWDRDAFEERVRRRLLRKYPEAEARRMFAFAMRYDQIEYVQRVQDQYRTTLVEIPGLVQFSHSLTWGARRRALHMGMIKMIDDME